MAVTTTSAPQQQVAMPASDLRQFVGSLVVGEGTRLLGDLVVAQRAAGANMSVDVAAGSAVVQDDHTGGGGFYGYTLGATTNVAVSGADPTNPRVDRVVIRVRDQALGDAANDQAPIVVAGTPTAGATLVNLNGAAAVPASSLLLANILVPAASSSVTTANIDVSAKPMVQMAGAMTKLYENVLLSAAASIDTGQVLPGNFSNLRIEFMGRGDTAAATTGANLRLDNDSGTNYYSQRVRGNAATASAAESLAQTSFSAGFIPANTATATFAGSVIIEIPAYANTTFSKAVTAFSSCASATTTGTLFTDVTAGIWATSSAINRVTVLATAGNFVAGSRLTIYGL